MVGDELAVRRRHGLPAQHLGVVGQRFGLAEAVGRQRPHLDLAGLVGQGDQRLVVKEARLAVADALLAGGLDEPPLFGRRHEHLAAGRYHHLVAVGRRVGGGQVIQRVAGDVLALLIEVGVERDRHDMIFPGGDVKKVNVGAELVGDAAVVERGVGGVPARHDW